MRVGAGGLLEQSVEQQPAGSGRPAVEPEGEFVEVVGQLLAADPVVQGAGCPSFEQRRDQVRPGHDRVEVIGEIARSGVMSEAVVGESGEHDAAIGADLGAGGDDLAVLAAFERSDEPPWLWPRPAQVSLRFLGLR